jgi:hypothetical protein
MHAKDEVTRLFRVIICLDLAGAEIVGVHEQMFKSDLGSFETGELRGEQIVMKSAIEHSQ